MKPKITADGQKKTFICWSNGSFGIMSNANLFKRSDWHKSRIS